MKKWFAQIINQWKRTRGKRMGLANLVDVFRNSVIDLLRNEMMRVQMKMAKQLNCCTCTLIRIDMN
jgi:hypothetical protein